MTHYNVSRLFTSTQKQYLFNESDRWTLFHSFAFDFSVWEIWGALLFGARLYIVPYFISRSPEDFYQFLKIHKITVLNQTPSAFQQLMIYESTLSQPLDFDLRYIIFGGEMLNPSILKPWFNFHKNCKIINMYGITETTVHVTYGEISAETVDSAMISDIGQRISDLKLYILDRNLQPVPRGVIGELYVGGPGVTRGYYNRPELTKERFIPNPFLSEHGKETLYKTGDLVRYFSQDKLEYIGRIDHQVKIWGFRIEFGEIEKVISQISQINDVIVIVDESHGNKRLLAYLVCSDERVLKKDQTINEIKKAIIKILPDYMNPVAYLFIEKLPLNINGKLDKKLLPKPNAQAFIQDEYVPPETNIERLLIEILGEILNNQQISIKDNFFRLGGDSIISYQFIMKAKKSGLLFSIKQLYENPTIEELAKQVATVSVESPVNVVCNQNYSSSPGYENVLYTYPLSNMQKIMIKNYKKSIAPVGVYHSQLCYLFEINEFSKANFLRALELMIIKHPIFNLGFNLNLNNEVQYVRKVTKLRISENNLAFLSLEDQKNFIEAYLKSDREHLFSADDIENYLFRFALFTKTNTQFYFVISLHHAIEDGWGMGEFLKDLFITYQRICIDNNIIVEPARNIHQDFVKYEIALAASEPHQMFWREYLQNVKPFSLPLVEVASDEVATIFLDLNKSLYCDLTLKSKDLKVTIKSIFLSAFASMISKITLSDLVTIGVVSNGGRNDKIDGSLNALGLFWNIVPVKIALAEDHLKQINHTHANLLSVEPYVGFPMNESYNDLFFSTFNFVNFHNFGEINKDIKIIDITGHDKFHYPLNFSISYDVIKSEIEIKVDYDNRFFNSTVSPQ